MVFELNGDSGSGTDSITEFFYQVCWDVIGMDVLNMVNYCIEGHTLLKYITQTNLVLILRIEKEGVQTTKKTIKSDPKKKPQK